MKHPPKHETLNRIILEMRKYRPWIRYGEIGTAYGDNYAKIRADERHGCEINADRYMSHAHRHGDPVGLNSVDYMDSFAWVKKWMSYGNPFDLIFIDGDHKKKAVEDDIIGSWTILRPGGIMVLHDVHPTSIRMATDNRPENPREAWCGAGWRSFIGFRNDNPQIPSGTLQENWGLGWIQKTQMVCPEFEPMEIPWDYFQDNSLDLLGYSNGFAAIEKALTDNYQYDDKRGISDTTGHR